MTPKLILRWNYKQLTQFTNFWQTSFCLTGSEIGVPEYRRLNSNAGYFKIWKLCNFTLILQVNFICVLIMLLYYLCILFCNVIHSKGKEVSPAPYLLRYWEFYNSEGKKIQTGYILFKHFKSQWPDCNAGLRSSRNQSNIHGDSEELATTLSSLLLFHSWSKYSRLILFLLDQENEKTTWEISEVEYIFKRE